jgi:hypothetical protein
MIVKLESGFLLQNTAVRLGHKALCQSDLFYCEYIGKGLARLESMEENCWVVAPSGEEISLGGFLVNRYRSNPQLTDWSCPKLAAIF